MGGNGEGGEFLRAGLRLHPEQNSLSPLTSPNLRDSPDSLGCPAFWARRELH
jgi:hypothetical protein